MNSQRLRVFSRITLLLFIFSLVPRRLWADNLFDFRPGAAGMGMGMAYSSIASGPDGLFFNPAGTANTAYTQTGGTMGRLDSPNGPMSYDALSYVRPYDPKNTATVGAAYLGEQQTGGPGQNTLLLNYAQDWSPQGIPLSNPLQVGANMQFINDSKGPHSPGTFGLGLDAGVIARSNSGLRSSLTVMNLTTESNIPAALDLGSSYTWHKWLTLAGDIYQQQHLLEFYPGLEASFDEGLLKLRTGKGFQLDGIPQWAFGFGIDLSPVTLDVAWDFPTSSINRQGGGYEVSFNYFFGAPSFWSKFVGNAAQEAESLKEEIQSLGEKESQTQTALKTIQTGKDITSGELNVLESRVKDLQNQYQTLQKKNDELKYQIRKSELKNQLLNAPPAQPQEIPRPKAAPKALWPQKHTIKAGDTLRSLAKKYYHNPDDWEVIYDANQDKINRGIPEEGSVFTIPPPP